MRQKDEYAHMVNSRSMKNLNDIIAGLKERIKILEDIIKKLQDR